LYSVCVLGAAGRSCKETFLAEQANSEEFIPIFANNRRELKAFLEHMIEVEPFSPAGVYDTLLELRLHDWAHEEETEVLSYPPHPPPPPVLYDSWWSAPCSEIRNKSDVRI